ncbi:hypothetical protein [Candidatus Protochlamydia phocaeensis]|uniref:hypothetical protein n=1 Tax=Candidatus Protochlamydia phocaeensis TaxID=1414722 RepID=UPI000838C68E|nr:hypothetical protein [Candidatus Protochlamydia phocaeensis]
MTDLSGWVMLLSITIILTFCLLFFAFWFGWWISQRGQGVSPYTGLPLRRATDLSYFAAERVLRFMYNFRQYDNRIFKLKRAAFCRETGRIFTNCVTWMETVKVDWTFLQKRYPGNYVSWGSLNDDQQRAIRDAHDSLEGFQTDFSSPSPSPRAIEPEYIYVKPGPLYVDIETKVLLGWKIVPGTELEVLIVQKPVR